MRKDQQLLKEIKACTICQDLPLGPNPILQFSSKAKILVAGQAPGQITHHKGRPFDDASGDRLREWLGINRDTFYNPEKLAVVPMGFCYPGKGKSGDLAPKAICAATWRNKILKELPNIELTLVIGKYAMDWHLPERKEKNLTETVRNWKHYIEQDNPILPLPHPSPRNNIWLKKNPWFEEEVVKFIRKRASELIRN
ncbi:uracil-DNA glycosylase [Kangiella profundi]|uniref:Uracil-DNA glycosylase n=1 Tax=Kangiella profundi TaxID=1561924 RepID=A0A2K9B1F2_9GAMM|nr:uracil-DNA glycosylase family protein [Kangiella profundi]AUD79939.1 uracil-DNA glycosylase [Kangiella profundi]GGE94040.1 IclR family transcriptional regulator [Kangiella profundi]